MEVTFALASEMLELAGIDSDPRSTIADGSALAKWNEMIRAQDGDPDARLPEAPEREMVLAESSGVLTKLDARAVGIAAWRLGAGRARKEDPVSPSAGVVCLKKPGDAVEKGEPILELHADEPGRFGSAVAALEAAVEIGREAAEQQPMILERIRA